VPELFPVHAAILAGLDAFDSSLRDGDAQAEDHQKSRYPENYPFIHDFLLFFLTKKMRSAPSFRDTRDGKDGLQKDDADDALSAESLQHR